MVKMFVDLDVAMDERVFSKAEAYRKEEGIDQEDMYELIIRCGLAEHGIITEDEALVTGDELLDVEILGHHAMDSD